ncbi:hypothetical protein D9M71_434670 [compost metagenome]
MGRRLGVRRAALAFQQGGVEAEGRHHIGHVALALAQGLAGVEGFQPRQVLAIGLDGLGDAPQDRGPLADTQPGPVTPIEGLAGSADGGLGIRRAGHRHLRQHILVGRVDHWPQPGLDRVAPLAVDEEWVGRHARLLGSD